MKALKETVLVIIAIVFLMVFFVGAMHYIGPLPIHEKLMILW